MTTMRNLQPQMMDYGNDVARALEGYSKVYSGDRIDRASNALQKFVDTQAMRNATQGDYAGYGSMSPEVAKDILNMKRIADQDVRQVKLDEQNKQLFDLKIQEADRLNQERESLNNFMSNLPSTTATKTIQTPAQTIPAIAGNEAERKAIEEAQIAASQKYLQEFAKASEMNSQKVDRANVYNTIALPNPGGSRIYKYQTETGKTLPFDPNSILGKLVYRGKYTPSVPMPKYTPEQIHKIAMQKSGVSGVQAIPELVQSSPEQIVPASTRTVASELGKQDWIKQASDRVIQDQSASGAVKMKMLEDLRKYADSLYGKAAAQPTIANILAAERLNIEKAKIEGEVAKKAAEAAKKAAEANAKLKSEREQSTKSLKALNNMYTEYGSPGSWDKPDIEEFVVDTQQTYRLTDSQMADVVNAARSTYANAAFGVNEEGFKDTVKKLAKDMQKKASNK